MNPPASQTAIVLSGGGAYGAFSVGIMKVLFAGRSPATNYQPLRADLFVGTSVGALNATVMAGQGNENQLDAVQRLQDIWINRIAEAPGTCGNGILRLRGDPTEYLDPNCYRSPSRLAENFVSDTLSLSGYFLARSANFIASSEPLLDRALTLVNIESFVDSSPYQHLLREVISEENIRRSSKRLCIVATNWITGAPARFTNSDFHDNLGIQAVAASSAVPGIFPPVRIGQDLFVDGGAVENTPLSPAINMGATELHVIYLDPNPQYIPLPAEANTTDTLLRVYYVMLASKINEDIETARWINAGLRALEGFLPDSPDGEKKLRDFIRVANKILGTQVPYKILTIHRYFPKEVLGGNLGMLEFDLANITRMIAEGERVALLHNCTENGCVVDDAHRSN